MIYYKVGVIGHTTDRFNDVEKAQRMVNKSLEVLSFQYNTADTRLIFNIFADIGVGFWTSDYCIKNNIKYHLFLPHSIDQTCEHWYDEQKEAFKRHVNNAYAISVINHNNNDGSEFHHSMIDDSNFIICFWEGNRAGIIPNVMRYALLKNKLLLRGGSLKLITINDLK